MIHPATTTSTQLPAYAMPTHQPFRYLSALRGLSFTVWLFLLVAIYWRRQEWNDVHYQMAEGGIQQYLLGGFLTALIVHLTLGVPSIVNAVLRLFASPSSRFFFLFCLFCILTTPLSTVPWTSFKYAAATFMVMVTCYLIWENDYATLRRMLVFTGLVLFAWLIILMLHHGLRNNTVGGINRNMIGKLAMGAMALCLFSHTKWIRWGAIGFTAFVLVLITSRGSMVAVFALLASYFILHKGISRSMGYGIAAWVLATMVLLSYEPARDFLFEKVMRLHDENRGLGSGLTGRVDNWMRGLGIFGESPVLGHGFRSTKGGVSHTHGGYINLLVETGVVGTVLILSAVGLNLWRRIRELTKLRRYYDEAGISTTGPAADAFQINAIAVGVILAVLCLWVYEPLYVNLGNVMSILFFLMLAAPLRLGDAKGTAYA